MSSLIDPVTRPTIRTILRNLASLIEETTTLVLELTELVITANLYLKGKSGQ